MIKAINYLTVCAILIALFGPSAIARADTHTVMGNTMHLEVSDIDPTRTGTLTLIKRVGEQPRPVPGFADRTSRIFSAGEDIARKVVLVTSSVAFSTAVVLLATRLGLREGPTSKRKLH